MRPYRLAMRLFTGAICFFGMHFFCRLNLLSIESKPLGASPQQLFWSRLGEYVFQAIATASLIGFILCFLVFLYRGWAIIQDGRTPVTPGRSVGFLFIPLFQCYWVFVSIFGLPRALNRYADRHQLIAPRASVLLGLAVPIYLILAPVPYLGSLLSLVNLFLLPIYMFSILRTARCFCEGNQQFTSDNVALEYPMATRRGWIAGIAAILLLILGPPVAMLGYSLAQVSKNEWVIAEKNWNAKGPKKRGMEKGQIQVDLDELTRKWQRFHREEREARESAYFQIFAFWMVAAAGVLGVILAIVLAVVARRSNATLNQTHRLDPET